MKKVVISCGCIPARINKTFRNSKPEFFELKREEIMENTFWLVAILE